MRKNECLALYQQELIRQENPYQQWIVANEVKNVEEYEEVNALSLRVCVMEEFTSSFAIASIQEDILLLAGEEGWLAAGAQEAMRSFFQMHPEADIVYADEDVLDEKTQVRSEPWFKPEYAPDSLLSNFYFGHILAFRVDKFRSINLLCGKDYRVNIYDFVLKAVEITDGIYHLPQILFHQDKKKIFGSSYGEVIGVSEEFDQIKVNACRRRKMQGILAKDNIACQYGRENAYNDSIDRKTNVIKTICYDISANPLVSVIIPSKDHAELLETCITSFLQKTSYRNLEFIVVDNGSNKEQRNKIIQFLQKTFTDQEKGTEQLNCYYDYEEEPFNFSKMCNRGVRRAQGEYLLFLNDDIEIITDDWLSRMLGQAMQANTGAVGAKLLYPTENKIQHIGITNMGIGPAHKLNGFPDNQIYAHGENCLVWNKIAVTGACLLVAREKFEQAGRFMADLAVAYNDVALCFSLLQKGYLNVVRNDAVLLHHESISRGMEDTPEKRLRFRGEKQLLYRRYPKWEKKDPYYSPYWVQERKDTDYTCNYIYEYENPILFNRITIASQDRIKNWHKKKSEVKLVRKLLNQDALLYTVEAVQGREPQKESGQEIFFFYKEDTEETPYLQIEGWAALKREKNACYEIRLLLEAEDGTVYECNTFSKVRRDVEQVMEGTRATECALTGFVVRVPHDRIAPGIYKIGVAAKSKISQKYIYATWNEKYRLYYCM